MWGVGNWLLSYLFVVISTAHLLIPTLPIPNDRQRCPAETRQLWDVFLYFIVKWWTWILCEVFWLVVDLPFCKIWKSVGMIIPNIYIYISISIYISICIYIYVYIYVYIYGKKCSKPSTSCCSSHPRLLALTWQAPHRGYPKVRFWTSSHVARHWGLPQLGIQIAAGCIPVLSSPHYMPILLGFVANVFLVIHGIGSKYIGKYAQNILLNMFVLLWYT